MVEISKNLTTKLLDLMNRTGYPLVQHNGQRKFGPPGEWTGPTPQKGCEVFVGKLPREIFEDELVPLFSTVGKIYEMRLMMDFSGSNRGYAFVTFSTKAEAQRAVRELNGYEIRPGRNIGVVKSVDNCRLFVGNILKTKTREEVWEELSKCVSGIVDVILYKNCYDRRQNRGFAFVEFTSHRAAAMARRELVPGFVKLWGQDVTVDWAEPEPDIDDDQMRKVKVLYVRNFLIKTTPDTIKSVFEAAIGQNIERVKKIYDYAFIHFHEREHAELAMKKLQNTEIDGVKVEIKWAKPVDRDLYRIQKQTRGNAKFNNSSNLSQTLLLYKQHLERREHEKDEGIGSACGGSHSMSPSNHQAAFNEAPAHDRYLPAPVKLNSLCKGYTWALPVYDYQQYLDPSGNYVWIGIVELPHVGLPLLNTPRRIGPLWSEPCITKEQAQAAAAEIALGVIRMMRSDHAQHPSAASPMQSPYPAVYPAVLPQVPNCIGVPYINTPLCNSQIQISSPPYWI